MIRILKLVLVLYGLLLFASTGWSLTIDSMDSYNGLDVGIVDTWLHSAEVENSIEKETEWVQNYFSDPTITVAKYDPPTVYQTNDPDVWALELEYQPEYFYVKVGIGQTTYSHHLFRNDNASYDWGVFDTSYLTYNGKDIEIGLVSHGGGAGAAPVPEPATMLLLGTGLAGLAGFRRKFKK